MKELNNLPDFFLDKMIEERRQKVVSFIIEINDDKTGSYEISEGLKEYVALFLKVNTQPLTKKDEIKNFKKFLVRLRKYHKIEIVRRVYTPKEIETVAAEYLYTHYGPVEIRRLCPGLRVSEEVSIDEKVLKNCIKESFPDFNDYGDAIKIPLDEGKDDEADQSNKNLHLEAVITKIMPMYEGTNGILKKDKILIQISVFDKYMVFIDDHYQLQEIMRVKIVNTVLDMNRMILQIRSDHAIAEDFIIFFKMILGQHFSFKEIAFDEQLIDLIKLDQNLNGRSYEYIGKKLITGGTGGESQASSVGTKRAIIEKKSIKKASKNPPYISIKSAPSYPPEVSDYPLESDLFNFPFPISEDEEENKKGPFYRLQLTMEHSRLYFRKLPSESVIDHVLDRLNKCFPSDPNQLVLKIMNKTISISSQPQQMILELKIQADWSDDVDLQDKWLSVKFSIHRNGKQLQDFRPIKMILNNHSAQCHAKLVLIPDRFKVGKEYTIEGRFLATCQEATDTFKIKNDNV